MRGCQKTGERSKATNISNHKTRTAPHFLNAILLMSAQSAKSEAILRRTTIKPNKGASPCRHEQTQRIPYGYPMPYIYRYLYLYIVIPREKHFPRAGKCSKASLFERLSVWEYLDIYVFLLVIHTVMNGFGAFHGFVQGRAPLKVSMYGRLTRGSPPLQGMPLLENSPPDCFPIHPMRSALR